MPSFSPFLLTLGVVFVVEVLSRRRHLIKIGEGSFGEVFRCPAHLSAAQDKQQSLATGEEELVAVKVVPVEGSVQFNGDSQKSYNEVLSEVIITKELTALGYGLQNQTEGFVQLKK
ncbi:unnamed protein product [Echinostoma caproni]|uniref:Protein kinase domain-containing protein n=1 Tax=Echinostoma caproni TaxID=27848 RepID=A0A3P8L7I6_9TREM|nr:unnamed protein product [Echinostoma caproni]